MEDAETLAENTRTSVLLTVGSFVLGGLALVVGYIANLRGKNSESAAQNSKSLESNKSLNSQISSSGSCATVGNSNSGLTSGKRAKNKKRREIQQEFTHSWMVGALKGHTAPVLDINFSSNGKFLASCAEDRNLAPDGTQEQRSRGDFGFAFPPSRRNVSNDTIGTSPKDDTTPPKSQEDRTILSRRQRKNRTKVLRERTEEMKDMDHHQRIQQQHERHSDQQSRTSGRDSKSSSADSKTCDQRKINVVKNEEKVSPIKIHSVPNFDDSLIKKYGFFSESYVARVLRTYILPADKLIQNGYPVVYEHLTYDGVEIPLQRNSWGDDSYSMIPGFVYYKGWSPRRNELVRPKNGGSVESSDQDSSSDSENVSLTETASYVDLVNCFNRVQRWCSRCNQNFDVRADDQEYVPGQSCLYHPEVIKVGGNPMCTCCRKPKYLIGCVLSKYHVWSGSEPGLNGPFINYVQARPRQNYGAYHESLSDVYSLDCEMCYTKDGLELSKITVIDIHGYIVYDHFVKPRNKIIDYNTRYSGITKEHLEGPTKSLQEVQQDILEFIHADTILVGHGLENDLRALKMVHYTVIDTSLLKQDGMNSRASLKTLALKNLCRIIQTGSHNSKEDATVAMEILLLQVHKDLCAGTLS